MLRFVDGFAHYSTAQMGRKWVKTNSPTITSGGRYDSGAMVPAGNNNYVTAVLDNQATWTVGFAFKFSTLPGSVGVICALVDTATTQVDLRLNSTGTLAVTRNGTTLATSAFALSVDVWYYIEMKVVIHSSTGTYEVRVGGTARIGPTTGANTQATGNASANRLSLGGVSLVSAAGATFDDFYVCDGTGALNNSFLGDCRVETIFPTGVGNLTEWTPSAGNNWQCVDENPATDDTDYVSSSTAGQGDTYQMGNLATAPASVFGVAVNLTARKDDAGARSVASIAHSGGTDFDGATVALGDTYTVIQQIWEQDPNGPAAWNGTTINAAEFGVDLIA